MNQITQSRIQTYKPSVNRRPRTIERLRNNDRLEAWRWYKGIVGPFFRDWGWWKFSVFFVYFCTLDYRLFGKVKRGIKKLGLTMNIYIICSFKGESMRRGFEVSENLHAYLWNVGNLQPLSASSLCTSFL